MHAPDFTAGFAPSPLSVFTDGEPVAAELDPECLEGLRALSENAEEDVLADVIALYHANAPGQLAAARLALAAQDAPALRTAAHSLKGSSAQFGATAMEEVCASLEMAARSGQLADAEALLRAVEREFHRLMLALAVLGKNSPTS